MSVTLLAKQTITKQFVSEFKKKHPNLQLILENVSYNAQGKEYVLFVVNPTATQRIDLGSSSKAKRHGGTVFCTINIPKAAGAFQTSDRGYEIADYITEILEEQVFTDSDSRLKIMFQDADYGKLGFVDEYFVITVSIPYRIEYFQCNDVQ